MPTLEKFRRGEAPFPRKAATPPDTVAELRSLASRALCRIHCAPIKDRNW